MYGRKDNKSGILCNKTDGGNSSTYDTMKIAQYDLNGNLLKVWNSVKKVSKYYKLSDTSIYNAIHGSTKRAGKFMWRCFKIKPIKKINKYKNAVAKEVIQYSLKGVKIKKWDSSASAGFTLNIGKTSIIHCINGRSKTAGGFIWKKA